MIRRASLLPLAAFPLALVVSLVATPLALKLAWAIGYLDQPADRKLHTTATALLGGAAVFVSALVAWGVLIPRIPHESASWEGYYLLAGAAVALALGLWDDRFGMRPSVKMLGQATAAVILIAGGAVPEMGLPIGIEAAITLIGLVMLMNAVNFLDNMNGMVGGMATLLLAGFAWTSLQRGALGVAAAQLALAGACAGFLPFNFPRARIFLGDAGSLLLGYSLGASAVLAVRGAPTGWGQIGPLLMLAYPAFDITFVVLMRLRDGRPVYQGGRDHTNHRLASLITWTRTVPILWVTTAALCASGLVSWQLNRPGPTLLLSALWTILFCWSGLRLSSVPIAPHPSR